MPWYLRWGPGVPGLQSFANVSHLQTGAYISITEAKLLSVLLGMLTAHGCHLDDGNYCWGYSLHEDTTSKSLPRRAKGLLAKNWVWKSNLNGEREHLVANLNDT